MEQYTKPEQQQIDHWLKVSFEMIVQKKEDYQTDFYKVEDLPSQSFYAGIASSYAALANAQFLNGEASEIYRTNFSKATNHIIKSFKMVYDKNDSDYIGDKEETDFSGFGYGCVSWFKVSERVFIEGFHYALMASDFEQTKELAKLFQDRPDGRKLDKEINRYAHALKCAAFGENEQGKHY